MEHRHGERKAVNIRSSIEIISGSIPSACIKNVSFAGIYVELPTENLWVHAPIKVEFRIQQENTLRTYCWRGFITRLTPHGVGAMFESADPKEQAGLLALLNFADRSDTPSSLAC